MTTRKNRQTGTMITVGRSADLGLDPQGGWLTICEDHGYIVSHPTRKLAERHASDPLGWCEQCIETHRRMQHDPRDDYRVERYTGRGPWGWRIIHVPSGRAFGGQLHGTRESAQAALDDILSEPEIWVVAYPTGNGIVWETEKYRTEQDARRSLSQHPNSRLERWVLNGEGYTLQTIAG